jgi:predicted outer membrane protein
MYRSSSKHQGFVALAIVAAAAFPLTACEDDDETSDDPQIEQERQAGEQMGQQLADQLEQDIGDINTAPEEQVTGKVASVTRTINTGEIQQAELALDRAEDQEVIDLAQHILDDHTRAMQQEEQALEDLQYAPIDTTAARTLQTAATEATLELEQMRGAAFDREYTLLQVRMHASGLEVMNAAEEWVPDNEFRTYAQDLRGSIQEHLSYAIDVAEQLNRN